MARINTNIASLIAQRNLARTSQDLGIRLERLSTGLRINKGADDPAGLIISERLRSELKGLGQAIVNSERASSVIATTEGYLAEIADLLTSLKALVIESANTGGISSDEIDANQLQIDDAISSITRIANTATFGGLQLLNGALEYVASGVVASAITDFTLHRVQFAGNSDVTVSVEVVASAQTGSLFLSGNTTGAPGALLSTVTLEIMGNEGVQSLTFISGTALSAVVAAVNTYTNATGVSASLVDTGAPPDQTSGLTFNSVAYGEEQFASVRKVGTGADFFSLHDAQGMTNSVERDEGVDVTAIINGVLATGRGLRASLASPVLSLELMLDETYAQTTGVQREFVVTGGGVDFQLGPHVSTNEQVSLGIGSVASTQLGGTLVDGVLYHLDSIVSGQVNNLSSNNLVVASDVIDNAITVVAVLRCRLGAFERNTLQTNIRSLQIGVENIAASESKIRDADFAAETAALTRAQILIQAGTSVLATSNLVAQNVLALLQ